MRFLRFSSMLLMFMLVATSAFAHSGQMSATKPSPATVIKPAPADPSYKPSFKEQVSVRHESSRSEGDVDITDWYWIPHIHTFENIYNTYDGFDPDERLAGPQSCPATGTVSCNLGYSQSRTWSHKFGVNIQFEVQAVKVGVGYDVTYSSQAMVTHSVTFQPGYTAEIWRNQWYHVQEYNVKNTYCWGSQCWDEHGTGWAAQWFKNQVDPRVY